MINDDLQLRDRRIAVTGAASGIGLATVRALAKSGARLALLDCDAAALAAIADELMTTDCAPLRFVVDVVDESRIEEAFSSIDEAWGGLEVLIHVAGIMREQATDIREISADSWNHVLAVNLSGAFLACRAASRIMIPQQKGTMILIGSRAGVASASGSIPYGASKGGVNGLAMTLQKHLAPHHIRVHNFCPGSVDTPLFNKSLDERISHGASPRDAESARAGSVDAAGVGQAIALLASPLAEYLQGPIFSR